MPAIISKAPVAQVTVQPSGIFNDTTTGNIYYNPTGVTGDIRADCTVGVAAVSLDNTDFVYSA